jgi:hypothetical protein
VDARDAGQLWKGKTQMSVVEIMLSPRAERLRTRVEEFCRKKNLVPPDLKLELQAGAIGQGIDTIRSIVSALALDEDLDDSAKEDLSNFLAQLSLQLKRLIAGSPQRDTEMTASRVTGGHAFPGELHGERHLTVVPKSSRIQRGSVEISDGNDIRLIIDDAVKVG